MELCLTRVKTSFTTFDMDALDRAITAAGSGAELARHLGVSRAAISYWRRKQVPSLRVLEVERLTGVSRQELRPDLYPPDEVRA